MFGRKRTIIVGITLLASLMANMFFIGMLVSGAAFEPPPLRQLKRAMDTLSTDERKVVQPIIDAGLNEAQMSLSAIAAIAPQLELALTAPTVDVDAARAGMNKIADIDMQAKRSFEDAVMEISKVLPRESRIEFFRTLLPDPDEVPLLQKSLPAATE